MQKKRLYISSAFQVTLVYLFFSLLWILLSDKLLLSLTENLEVIGLISSIKGLLFVSLSGLLIYTLVQKKISEKNLVIRDLDKEVSIRAELIKELHHRIKNNLQVFASLVNIESAVHEDREVFLFSLGAKIQSMLAVFNVVYNYEDMRNISLDSVLKEYSDQHPQTISYEESACKPQLNVETITTLILAMDAAINAWRCQSETPASIQISTENSIEIIIHQMAEQTAETEKGKEFIEMQLNAIHGSIRIDHQKKTLCIEYAGS